MLRLRPYAIRAELNFLARDRKDACEFIADLMLRSAVAKNSSGLGPGVEDWRALDGHIGVTDRPKDPRADLIVVWLQAVLDEAVENGHLGIANAAAGLLAHRLAQLGLMTVEDLKKVIDSNE